MEPDFPPAAVDSDAAGASSADRRPPVEPPDDPRVPQPADAEPDRSKELGGAAPAVGPRDEPAT